VRPTIVIPPAVHKENLGCVNFTCKARGTPTPWLKHNIQFQCRQSAIMLGRLRRRMRIYNFHIASSNSHFLHHNFSLTTTYKHKSNGIISYRCMVNIDVPRTVIPTTVIPLAVHREQVAFVISQDLEGSYFCSLNNMSSNTLDLVGKQKC